MSLIGEELEATLKELGADSVVLLERLVRDAMDLARTCGTGVGETDERGWPTGYFEETAGSFANEPLDFPVDPPLEPIANW